MPRLVRALRRSLVFLVAGAVLLLLAIPAQFDLRSLFVGLGVVALGLGVVRGLFSAFEAPVSRPRRERAGR